MLIKTTISIIKTYKIFFLLFAIFAFLFSSVFVLKMPNNYKIDSIFNPKLEQRIFKRERAKLKAALGLISSTRKSNPQISYKLLLKNHDFMKRFIIKHNIIKRLRNPNTTNYEFLFGYRGVYDFFKKDRKENKENRNKKFDDIMFKTIKLLSKKISIKKNKSLGLITFSARDKNRFLAKELLELFIHEASLFLYNHKINEINAQIINLEKEFQFVKSVNLKKSLSQEIQSLKFDKVFIKDSPYYGMDLLRKTNIPNKKDYVAPNRTLRWFEIFISLMMIGFIYKMVEYYKKRKCNT